MCLCQASRDCAMLSSKPRTTKPEHESERERPMGKVLVSTVITVDGVTDQMDQWMEMDQQSRPLADLD